MGGAPQGFSPICHGTVAPLFLRDHDVGATIASSLLGGLILGATLHLLSSSPFSCDTTAPLILRDHDVGAIIASRLLGVLK